MFSIDSEGGEGEGGQVYNRWERGVGIEKILHRMVFIENIMLPPLW